MSSVTEVDAESFVRVHSSGGADDADSADDAHSALRRMFSTSVLGSLFRRDIGTLKVV